MTIDAKWGKIKPPTSNQMMLDVQASKFRIFLAYCHHTWPFLSRPTQSKFNSLSILSYFFRFLFILHHKNVAHKIWFSNLSLVFLSWLQLNIRSFRTMIQETIIVLSWKMCYFRSLAWIFQKKKTIKSYFHYFVLFSRISPPIHSQCKTSPTLDLHILLPHIIIINLNQRFGIVNFWFASFIFVWLVRRSHDVDDGYTWFGFVPSMTKNKQLILTLTLSTTLRYHCSRGA